MNPWTIFCACFWYARRIIRFVWLRNTTRYSRRLAWQQAGK